jgi:hypothetical protein
MQDLVSKWVQEGQIYVWRYRSPPRGLRGWHFTGDPTGCRSIRSLLDHMAGGTACHRTLALGHASDAIVAVPVSGRAVQGHFTRLRIEYRPNEHRLGLTAEDDRLTMTVGGSLLVGLASAFTSVEIGQGDFGLATSKERDAEIWWFWWMPQV